MKQFVDFGAYKVFKTAGINTGIYVLQKGKPEGKQQRLFYSRIETAAGPEEMVASALLGGRIQPPVGQGYEAIVEATGDSPFRFVNTNAKGVLRRLNTRGTMRLKADDVAQGIVLPQETVTPSQLAKLRNASVRIGDGIFLLTPAEAKRIARTDREKALLRPYYTTKELQCFYGKQQPRCWLLYTTKAVECGIGYASVRKHLDKFRAIITSSNKPYGIHRPRDPYYFEGEKIIALRKTHCPHFTYTDYPCYVTQTFNIIKPRMAEYNLKYLTAILNSRLAFFWFLNAGKVQGNQLQVDIEPLLRFPIRPVDLTNSADKAAHDRMVALVDRILDLNERLAKAKNPNEKTRLQRLIDATDGEIDKLVYELYGLTPDEIAVVEKHS